MSGSIGDNVFRASGVIAAAAAGRTGTVDWQTDSIKTATFTAANAEGYFCNTTSGAFTVNLPAGVAGNIVAVSDYASTAASNNITIEPNGSDKINGINDGYTISTAGLAVSLVYADATRGWKSVTGSDEDATGVLPTYIAATGGSPSTGAISGDYKIHSFTGTGPLCVSAIGTGGGPTTIDYLIVAGGAGGGGGPTGQMSNNAGGGGAGGYRESVPSPAAWTGSPLANPGGAVAVTVQDYTLTVGGGGAGFPAGGSGGNGTSGGVSTFSTITSAGGGGGGVLAIVGVAGGSGGGGGTQCAAGGAGNTPAIACYPQGLPGGQGSPSGPYMGGGGGGATVAGGAYPCNAGGNGATTCISATPTVYAGGGGGGIGGCTSPSGGTGGGAAGGGFAGTAPSATGNTGGGGGGGGGPHVPPGGKSGGAGAPGVIIVRYKYQ